LYSIGVLRYATTVYIKATKQVQDAYGIDSAIR